MDYSKQERGNKMKLKALFVFFFGMVLSLIIVDIGLAKVIKTPTIEGKVIDATTGQPLENAIVSCTWLTSVANLVERHNVVLFQETVITDKDGNFKISSKKTWELNGLLRSFNGIDMSVLHPIYESKNSINDQQMNWTGRNYESLVKRADRNNVVVINIGLKALADIFQVKPWYVDHKGDFVSSIVDVISNRNKNIEQYISNKQKFDKGQYIIFLNKMKDIVNNYDDEKLWGLWLSECNEGVISTIYKEWPKERFSRSFSKTILLKELEDLEADFNTKLK